ncbi:hypothetical protein E3V33_05355 [Candidatus Marinimicrobia bacterium MT.SAG.4]|nr:hypothetical protein E3V33_05355 [Candidatus Marinimicrobia bacterium MT.SAG.4]
MIRIILLSLYFLVYFWNLSSESQPFGRVTFPLGLVEFSSAKNPTWKKVKLNQNLLVGESIRTAKKSRCEITLSGGGKLRIGENAELELTGAKIAAVNKEFKATIKNGQIWVAVKAAFGEKKKVDVRTPTAVAAIRGTKYRIIAGEEESSLLVYEGEVDITWAEVADRKQGGGMEEDGMFKIGPPTEVKPPAQVPGPFEVTLEEWITIVEGMQITIRKDGKYNMFKFDQTADANLDFVKWNRELDARQ